MSAPPVSPPPSDTELADILRRTRRIALIGASPVWTRPSAYVMKYLLDHGYEVIPINPAHSGETILGQKVHARLCDIDPPVDMINIFRKPEAIPAIVEEAVALQKRGRLAKPGGHGATIWMQLGLRHEAAAADARVAGLEVVMDRCLKREHSRLNGELRWGGINSGLVTAKKPKKLKQGLKP